MEHFLNLKTSRDIQGVEEIHFKLPTNLTILIRRMSILFILFNRLIYKQSLSRIHVYEDFICLLLTYLLLAQVRAEARFMTGYLKKLFLQTCYKAF